MSKEKTNRYQTKKIRDNSCNSWQEKKTVNQWLNDFISIPILNKKRGCSYRTASFGMQSS
jgi:hypothetical protein